MQNIWHPKKIIQHAKQQENTTLSEEKINASKLTQKQHRF